MIRKINSNKNGVIEYAIDNIEDLNKLPRKETDNTVYAILDKNGKRLVYLYSKAEKDYILINGDLEEINKEIKDISEQLDNIENVILPDRAINIRDLGAIGDGNSHKLSNFFNSLDEAKKIYEIADSLDDEIDWCAIQTALAMNKESKEGENYDTDKGYTILIPQGCFVVNKPLKILYSGTSVYGHGTNSIIKAIGENISELLSVDESNGKVLYVNIYNLALYGNKKGNGLHLNVGFGDGVDRRFRVDNIFSRKFINNFYFRGPYRDSIFTRLYSYESEKDGIYVETSDINISNSVSARANWSGFKFVANGSTQVTNCKSWRNLFHGFECNNMTMINLNACNAQDNEKDGFYLLNSSLCLINGFSDSNGGYGVRLNNTNNSNINISVRDRIDVNIPKHSAIARLEGNSSQNVIDIQTDLSRYISGETNNNSININSNKKSFNILQFAEEITFDLKNGDTFYIELTGNCNITHTGVLLKGDVVNIIMKQDDVGGRIVTFGSLFLATFEPNTWKNRCNTISFVWNGSRWIQTNVVTGIIYK